MELDDAMVITNPYRNDDDLDIRECLSSEMHLSEKRYVQEAPVQTIELQTMENVLSGSEEDTVSEKEGSKMEDVVKAEIDVESLENAISGDAVEKEYIE